jgi:saccharopine dehydrogenase (NAD+, L-lysine-forming)
VVGQRIAADLAPDFPGRIVVAGRRQNQADALARSIGNGTRGLRVDVTDDSSIAGALDGVAVAVNCIDQPDRAVLRAAIARGLAFTDITPHLVDLGRGAQFERVNTAATATGARIVLGAGLVPGISSVMVRALADQIGGVDSIETSLLLNAIDLSGPASLDYLLQELAMTFDTHVDGRDRRTRPFTHSRRVSYPAPIGERQAYLFPFSDQVLYPLTLSARTVYTRLSIDPPWLGRLLAILVGTRAVSVTARPGVRSVIGRGRHSRPAAQPAPYALRVDVTYRDRTATATTTGHGQAHATAVGAAEIVRALATGEVTQPGAWMPEQVIATAPFFDRLARAGIAVRMATGTLDSSSPGRTP